MGWGSVTLLWAALLSDCAPRAPRDTVASGDLHTSKTRGRTPLTTVALRLAIVGAAVLSLACATLGQFGSFVQAPRFEEARDQPAELRLDPPSARQALGGATIRLWTTVTNPNPFGFTLSSLRGTLFLEDARAATTEFPLGLPLSAGAETTIPIDLSVDFSELPQLATVLRRAVARQPIAYRFDGTVGVDAGRLGTPIFGPMTLMRGSLD